jgi:hypothetical protein
MRRSSVHDGRKNGKAQDAQRWARKALYEMPRASDSATDAS